MRTVRRRIYAAHLTVCRGIIEQLEQVEIDAFPTAFVTKVPGLHGIPLGCFSEAFSLWPQVLASCLLLPPSFAKRRARAKKGGKSSCGRW
jgi:hypothetical protein